MTEQPFIHPDRPELRWRPFKAVQHFRNLIADKEDTEQVFHIFQCLPRKAFRGEAVEFLKTDFGQALKEREPFLPDLLDDHDRLRAMPIGSVAHAYCDFMESEGLSAAGLVAEFEKFSTVKYHDQIEWYFNRSRDVHDLLHVLTGYGRDALGEASVLAFTYGQNPSPANIFIAYMAALNMKKTTSWSAPVLKAVRQAQKSGTACPRLIEQDITALLAEPLEAARARLNIAAPTRYREAHVELRNRGINPYDLLGQTA
ncbi:Coq4 family protein [Parasphingorhabdus sp. DH2-15]|uniref:Coq4 family protein n=1 Tax=Parasphingorhabdus sp. DH2-15 TaxID=3444112 RepID=UPI003F686906